MIKNWFTFSFLLIHCIYSYEDPYDINDKLTRASSMGDVEGVRAAIRRGADVNNRSVNDWTALIRAAERCQYEAVQILVDEGADVNVVETHTGQTALGHAMTAKKIHCPDDNRHKTILILEAAGAKAQSVNETSGAKALSVNEAAARGKLDEIKSAIREGANLDAIDKSGFTALEWCIIENRIEIAKTLLDARANPNFGSADDYPLIITAISYRRTVIVRLLVEAGAKLEARKSDGSTPLIEAANTGNAEIVSLLLNAGADTKAKNKNGKTALTIARESGHTEIIRLLE